MNDNLEFEEEEEMLLQMVNDFIESETSTTNPNSLSSSAAHNHAHLGDDSTHCFTLQKILRKETVEERMIGEKVRKYMRNKMELEKTFELKKWLVKCLKLDGLNASICHTSWITTPGCPCGKYEYIEIIVEEDDVKGMLERVIVDIDFKCQFEVARPTKSYKELSSKVPTLFVGSEDKLKTTISLLCSASQDSLREMGLHIPPWRKPTYIHSKYSKLSIDHNNYNLNVKGSDGDFYPRFGKWVPPRVMIQGWRSRDLGGGDSTLSNQFSIMGINCC